MDPTIKVINIKAEVGRDKKQDVEKLSKVLDKTTLELEAILSLPRDVDFRYMTEGNEVLELALHKVFQNENYIPITDLSSVLNENIARKDFAATHSVRGTKQVYCRDVDHMFAVTNKTIHIYGVRILPNPPISYDVTPANPGIIQLANTEFFESLNKYKGDIIFTEATAVDICSTLLHAAAYSRFDPPALTVLSMLNDDSSADLVEPAKEEKKPLEFKKDKFCAMYESEFGQLEEIFESKIGNTAAMAYEFFMSVGMKHLFDDLYGGYMTKPDKTKINKVINGIRNSITDRRSAAEILKKNISVAVSELLHRSAYLDRFGRDKYDNVLKFDPTRDIFDPRTLSRYKYSSIMTKIAKKEKQIVELSVAAAPVSVQREKWDGLVATINDPRATLEDKKRAIAGINKIAKLSDGWMISNKKKVICSHKMLLDPGADELIKKFSINNASSGDIYCKICGEKMTTINDDTIVSFVQDRSVVTMNTDDTLREYIRLRAMPVIGYLHMGPVTDKFRNKLTDYVCDYAYNFVAYIEKQVRKDRSLSVDDAKRKVDLQVYIYVWGVVEHIARVNQKVKLPLSRQEIIDKIITGSRDDNRTRRVDIENMYKNAIHNIDKAYEKIIINTTVMKETVVAESYADQPHADPMLVEYLRTGVFGPEFDEVLAAEKARRDSRVPQASFSVLCDLKSNRRFMYPLHEVKLDELNCFFGYYSQRCPEGGYHEYKKDVCKACGYTGEPSKAYYKKYAKKYEKRYLEVKPAKSIATPAIPPAVSHVISEEAVTKALELLCTAAEGSGIKMSKTHLVNSAKFLGGTRDIYHSDVIAGTAEIDNTNVRCTNLRSYIVQAIKVYNAVKRRPEESPLLLAGGAGVDMRKLPAIDVPVFAQPDSIGVNGDAKNNTMNAIRELLVMYVGYLLKCRHNINTISPGLGDEYLVRCLGDAFENDAFLCKPIPAKLATGYSGDGTSLSGDDDMESVSREKVRKDTDFGYSKIDYNGDNDEGMKINEADR